jgi:High potential iron-sulfur protein
VHPDPNDPTAKALGYVTNSAKPDASCGNYLQFQGKAADATGPCTIFASKNVASAGWCVSWAKKSLRIGFALVPGFATVRNYVGLS